MYTINGLALLQKSNQLFNRSVGLEAQLKIFKMKEFRYMNMYCHFSIWKNKNS